MNVDCTDNTRSEDDSSNKSDETKHNMHSLVKMAADKEDLVNLRGETTNTDLFKTFVNYCLIHLTPSVQWRYHAYNTNISDIFTVSDEALCMLIIENHANDFIRIHDGGVKLSRK